MILTCLLKVSLLLFMTLSSSVLLYILVFYNFFPHVFVLNNVTSCSVFCVLPSCNWNHWRVNTLPKLVLFWHFPSSIFIVCEYAFNIVSQLNCQISSSLDIFLTEFKFSKFLIIVLINLHVQVLFNLTSEIQEFSPREIYKGSWRHFSFPCSVDFDLFPTIFQTF